MKETKFTIIIPHFYKQCHNNIVTTLINPLQYNGANHGASERIIITILNYLIFNSSLNELVHIIALYVTG